jgi:ferric-dicitrate binding protein FerR (iron transport regulator)
LTWLQRDSAARRPEVQVDVEPGSVLIAQVEEVPTADDRPRVPPGAHVGPSVQRLLPRRRSSSRSIAAWIIGSAFVKYFCSKNAHR